MPILNIQSVTIPTVTSIDSPTLALLKAAQTQLQTDLTTVSAILTAHIAGRDDAQAQVDVMTNLLISQPPNN